MTPKIPILIVEDDKGLSELIKLVLANQQLSITVVHTGNEALAHLKNNSPHLMVVDFSLPDYNAQELVDELKNRLLQVPPFVVTTCQGDERIAVTMMKNGARDYLMKDFNFLDNLPGTIKRVLNEIEAEAHAIKTKTQNIYHDVIGNALSNLDSVVFCLSAEGFFIWVSKAVEDWGYHESELLGKHFLHVIEKNDWALVSNLLIDIISTQKCKGLHINIVTKTNHTKKTTAFINAGTNSDGNIIVGVMHPAVDFIN